MDNDGLRVVVVVERGLLSAEGYRRVLWLEQLMLEQGIEVELVEVPEVAQRIPPAS